MGRDVDPNTGQYPVAAADRAGLTTVLSDHWPAAYRLAVGLCGRGGVAAIVAARVLDRAVVAAPRWASDDQARRWFTRYTVLTARAAAVDAGEAEVAGLVWLRPLPSQQREAMVLHHGLGLDLHRMAAAMDCSSKAAANHLVAAVARLRGTGPLDQWTAELPAVLAAVAPPPAVVSADVARVVARRWRWAVARRWAGRLLVTAMIVVVAWAGWRLWVVLVF